MYSRTKNKDPKKKRNMARIFGKVLLALILLLFVVLLFIRSPWGQDMIIHKVVDYVSGKTRTKIEIDRLYITFSGNAYIEGLYLEDKQGDTLVYSRSLEASVPLLPLIKGDKINIVSLDWSGLVAKINRPEATGKFNFDFLIDAFATETDTTTKNDAPKLEIGTIRLNEFKIDYRDGVDGMDASLRLGTLLLEMEELDLDLMKFHVHRASITNTQISYAQTKSPKTDVDTTSTAIMPHFIVDHLEIGNTQAHYSSLPDEIDAELKIGTFLLKLPKADLAQRSIELEELGLNDSEIFYHDKKLVEAQTEPPPSVENNIAFEWPDWDIQAGPITMDNNRFRFESDSLSSNGESGSQVVDINNIALNLAKISLNEKSAQLDLHRLSFHEKNGLALNNLAFDLTFDQDSLSLAHLNATTQKSNINGNIKIGYTSINAFLNQPDAS